MLKHFNNVTTVDYADGQAFLDILKVKLNFVQFTFVVLLMFNVSDSMCSASFCALFR